NFQIKVSETKWLLPDLIERSVDFSIVRDRTRVPDALSFEALYDDPFVVIVGTQSPWHAAARSSLQSWPTNGGRCRHPTAIPDRSSRKSSAPRGSTIRARRCCRFRSG